MIRFRRLALALLLCAIAAGQMIPGLAGAQVETDEINQKRAELEEIRQQSVDAARKMEPLTAANLELEERAATLQEDLRLQQTDLASIEQAIAQAENKVLLAKAAVGEMTIEISALRESVRLQAVEAYLQPSTSGVSQMLTSEDITEAGRRRALYDTVQQRGADLLDTLRGAEELLGGLVVEAEQAELEVREQKVRQVERLAALEFAITASEQAQADLAARVAEVQNEVDGYQAEESASLRVIQQLVAEEQARLAEIERQRIAAEQAAIEAERARLAALTAPPVVAQETGQETSVALVEPAPAAAPAAGSMGWPANGPVTSGFGPRWGRMHEGIDISVNQGSPVFAASSGTVVFAGLDGGYGNAIVINHGGGVTTRYAHLSYFAVSVGQSVSGGSTIAQSGGAPGTAGAGSSTGAHLHFEVRVSGTAYDPRGYLG